MEETPTPAHFGEVVYRLQGRRKPHDLSIWGSRVGVRWSELEGALNHH